MLQGYEQEGYALRKNWQFSKFMFREFKLSSILVFLIIISISVNITYIVKDKKFYDTNYIEYHIGTIESNFSYSVNRLAMDVKFLKDNFSTSSLSGQELERRADFSKRLNLMIKHGNQYDYYLQYRYKKYQSTDFDSLEETYNEIFGNIKDDILSGDKARQDRAMENLNIVFKTLWGEEEDQGRVTKATKGPKEFSKFIEAISAIEEVR